MNPGHIGGGEHSHHCDIPTPRTLQNRVYQDRYSTRRNKYIILDFNFVMSNIALKVKGKGERHSIMCSAKAYGF